MAEQVSHHPPISAYYFACPEHNLTILGDLKPKSKFLGNSAATLMQGEIKVSFTNRPREDYFITMPNVYARGILFGTMLMELGDVATVKCPTLDLVCNLDFKVKVRNPPPFFFLSCLSHHKISFSFDLPPSCCFHLFQGYFTGTYNNISGKIKSISTGEVLYEISGKWSDELFITKKVW